MTEGHSDNPIVTILLSMGLGTISWLSNPDVFRALAVALLCGFVGGVARAAGVAAYGRYKDRKKVKPE